MNDPIHTKINRRLRGDRKLPNPFMGGNEFLAKLKTLPTLDDKRCHIVEANPLLLIFGEHLQTQKAGESYADYINRLYIGEPNGQAKATND